MVTQQKRRDSERLSCMQVSPYELTRFVDGSTVQLREGAGYSINLSIGGMLLLLPEKVDKQQVFEIQVPPEMKREEFTKLGEVRWIRPIPVDSCGNMYLVGIRFLLNLPASSQSPQSY
jgi:PilZ domain